MKNETNPWLGKALVFMTSQTISMFGSSVVAYAIVWYITLETSSAKMMTLSIICSFLPQIVVSLWAGVWADRYHRKTIIMLADLFIALATLLLALAFLSGRDSFVLLFAASVVRSIGSGIQTPAVGAILPQIVPEQHLTRMNSLNITVANVMNLLAPAVGGVVLASFGFAYALFIDVITALVAVGVMCFLKVPKHRVEKIGQSALSDLKDGLAFVKSHAFIGKLLLFYFVFYFMITPVAFLTPVMVERSYGADIWRLTASEMTWTIGSLLGGGLMLLWGGFKNRFHTMAFSCTGFGVMIACMGFATNFWVYLGFMVTSGLFMPLFSTAETVLLQENVEEAMLGRVFSMLQIITAASLPLGMLLFGPLGDMIPIEWIMIASGVIVVLLAPFIKGMSVLESKKQHE